MILRGWEFGVDQLLGVILDRVSFFDGGYHLDK